MHSHTHIPDEDIFLSTLPAFFCDSFEGSSVSIFIPTFSFSYEIS